MGAQLVSRAIVVVLPKPLSHAARVTVLVMALHAVDTDKRPSYFGGWGPLALALGYPDHTTAAAQRAVTRAVRELVDLGVIASEPTRPRSWKRRYWITLPGP